MKKSEPKEKSVSSVEAKGYFAVVLGDSIFLGAEAPKMAPPAPVDVFKHGLVLGEVNEKAGAKAFVYEAFDAGMAEQIAIAKINRDKLSKTFLGKAVGRIDSQPVFRILKAYVYE